MNRWFKMNIVSCDHGLWLVALRKYKRHIEYMPHCLLYVPFNFIVFLPGKAELEHHRYGCTNCSS